VPFCVSEGIQAVVLYKPAKAYLLCFWEYTSSCLVQAGQGLTSVFLRVYKQLSCTSGSGPNFCVSEGIQAVVLYKRARAYLLCFWRNTSSGHVQAGQGLPSVFLRSCTSRPGPTFCVSEGIQAVVLFKRARAYLLCFWGNTSSRLVQAGQGLTSVFLRVYKQLSCTSGLGPTFCVSEGIQAVVLYKRVRA